MARKNPETVVVSGFQTEEHHWVFFSLLASCTDLDIGVKQFDKL